MKTKPYNNLAPEKQSVEEENKGNDDELINNSEASINDEDTEELIEGDDLIEMDIKNEKKIEYSFSPPDGELEDESEDTGDLPEAVKKKGNRYNPTLSSGTTIKESELENEGIYIAHSDDIGLGYGENDYSMEEEQS